MKRYLERCLMVSLLLAVLLVLPAGAATKLFVPQGGTGATTLTGLLQGNGTSALTGITNSSTVGQALRVTGASTYAWGALDLADGDAITGALPFGNGGTGLASWTQYLIPYAATTTSIGQIAVGTDGQVLTSAGAGVAPAFEDAAAGGQTLYEAVVATSGGDYTTVGAAITAGATKIFVRAGTYNEGAITGASYTQIWGEGRNETIINIAGNDFAFAAGIELHDVKITSSGGLVTIGGASGGKFNYVDDTWMTSTGTTTLLDLNGITFFTNNEVSGSAIAASDYLVDLDAIYVANNSFKLTSNNTGSGVINITGGDAVHFVGNTISASSLVDGMFVATNFSFTNGVIVGNSFYGGAGASTVAVAISAAGAAGQGITGTLISGNLFKAWDKVIVLSDQNETVSITGNTLYSFKTGIEITGADQTVISGNMITDQNTGTTGIILAGTADDISITGNHIDAVTGIDIQASTITETVITGNTFEGFTTAITDLGLTTTISGNSGLSALLEKKYVRMKNTSGGALAVGDTVILKAVAAGDEVTTTTTQGDDLVFGMATATIADTAYGYFQVLGKTTALKVDGTTDIAIGDFIGTFTTAKIGMKAAVGDMAIAIALEAYATNDSSGVIDALLITPRKF